MTLAIRLYVCLSPLALCSLSSRTKKSFPDPSWSKITLVVVDTRSSRQYWIIVCLSDLFLSWMLNTGFCLILLSHCYVWSSFGGACLALLDIVAGSGVELDRWPNWPSNQCSAFSEHVSQLMLWFEFCFLILNHCCSAFGKPVIRTIVFDFQFLFGILFLILLFQIVLQNTAILLCLGCFAILYSLQPIGIMDWVIGRLANLISKIKIH